MKTTRARILAAWSDELPRRTRRPLGTAPLMLLALTAGCMIAYAIWHVKGKPEPVAEVLPRVHLHSEPTLSFTF